MKKMLMMGLCAVLSFTALGTQQIPDEIIFEGKNYKLHDSFLFLPMESYFLKHPDKMPNSFKTSWCTALHRRHVATFEIKDDLLYLTDIKVIAGLNNSSREFKWKSVLKDVFPRQKVVKMDWMTGLLLLWDEKAYHVHFVLEFDKGKLTKVKPYDNKKDGYARDFIDRQFEAFKKTDGYEAKKVEMQKIETPYVIDYLLRSEIPKIFVD